MAWLRLVHGEEVGQQRLQLDAAVVDEGDGPVVGVRVDEGTHDIQLLIIDVKGAELVQLVHGVNGEEEDGGAPLADLKGLLHGDGVAHALDDHVHPGQTGDLPHPGGQVLVHRVDGRVRAHLQANLPAHGHRLAEQHLAGPGHAGQLDHHQAHRAAAQDAHRVPVAVLARSMPWTAQAKGSVMAPYFRGTEGNRR